MEKLKRNQEVFSGNWSISKLEDLMECGKLYRYKHIERGEVATTGTLAFGGAVHKALELMHKDGLWDLAEIHSMWFDVWQQYAAEVDWENDILFRPKQFEKGIKILELYLKSEPWKQQVLGLEIKFSLPLWEGGKDFTGIIDKVLRLGDGRLAVVDYKTSSKPLPEDYLRADPQFTVYHAAATQLYGEAPVILYHHLISGKVLETHRQEGEINSVMQMVEEADQRIKGRQFGRNLHWGCQRCPFRQDCFSDLKGI